LLGLVYHLYNLWKILLILVICLPHSEPLEMQFGFRWINQVGFIGRNVKMSQNVSPSQ
jgi:hypothetical protein